MPRLAWERFHVPRAFPWPPPKPQSRFAYPPRSLLPFLGQSRRYACLPPGLSCLAGDSTLGNSHRFDNLITEVWPVMRYLGHWRGRDDDTLRRRSVNQTRSMVMNNRTFSQRTSLRLSATLLLVGQLLYVVVTQFHADGDANNHAAVFAEYADSGIWTAVHLGQFAG